MEFSDKKYEIYYDESNNIRRLVLAGDSYNIDNDPNQSSSPIFVLAGAALGPDSEDIEFDLLKEKLCLQATGKEELKFSQMVKIKAKYTPAEAFRYALGSKRFKTLFEHLLSKNIYIHYEMINTTYWSFLDIIEDLVVCTGDPADLTHQFVYKDCLYRLIKINKEEFLSIMTSFNYPNIEKSDSLAFLVSVHEHLVSKMNLLHSEQAEDELDYQMLEYLRQLFAKCIKRYSERVEFELVFDFEKDILIDDFSVFYLNRLKNFPSSDHILDNEDKVEPKIAEASVHDDQLRNIRYVFVDSDKPENYMVQISDVIAGFIKIYFDFLEYSDIDEAESFTSTLNPLQKNNLVLFQKLLDASVEECHLFLHRVIVPIDEHKASLVSAQI
ncbi:DUF3800 domain-containing protein [Halopseudomonas oceani]|uniref:DUF3800 domain-containing protein n=1 Tax=Halopseudomonas oceani TaxID=1708783 RepID=UPI002AA95228|nr:DUF3800 domain-containing protein [Halopseudomonas oceani]